MRLAKPAFLKAPTEPAAAPTLSARSRQLFTIGRLLTLAGCAAIGGTILLNFDIPWLAPGPFDTARNSILAATLLVFALHLVRSRKEGVLALVAWYAGSTMSLPFVWQSFFASGAGWLAWAALCITLALPALLAPKRRPAIGPAIAIALTAVPPLGIIGIGGPVMTAGALFPGFGWIGLALTVVLFGLSSFQGKWATVLQGAMIAWGLVHVSVPVADAQTNVWAVTSYEDGRPAKSINEFYDRQDRAIKLAMNGIREGAKIIVFPEATNTDWNAGQANYWRHVKEEAEAAGSQVLLGVYTDGEAEPRGNGLLDLTTETLYRAHMPVPVALWHPWSRPAHFPARPWAGGHPIQTVNGPAALLVCYEELLAWPLAWQMLGKERPTWIIATSNQWFNKGWMLHAQARSVWLQARLWGLPLTRAVNHATLD